MCLPNVHRFPPKPECRLDSLNLELMLIGYLHLGIEISIWFIWKSCKRFYPVNHLSNPCILLKKIWHIGWWCSTKKNFLKKKGGWECARQYQVWHSSSLICWKTTRNCQNQYELFSLFWWPSRTWRYFHK